MRTPRALEIDQRVAVSFDAIKESSYVLYEDGSVSSCGRNHYGQLGDGTNSNRFIASVELDGDSQGVVRLLGVGPSSESVFFATDDGRVYGTGRNDRGQLGVGDEEDRNVPDLVAFDGRVDVELISASDVHAVVLSGEGGVVVSPSPTARPTTPSPTEGSTVSLSPTGADPSPTRPTTPSPTGGSTVSLSPTGADP